MEELVELTVHLPILKHPFTISISPSSSFKTIVDGLCQQYKLPPYYTTPLLSVLTSTFNQTYLNIPNNINTSLNLSNTITDVNNTDDTIEASSENNNNKNTDNILDTTRETQARQRFINAYQENTLQYYNKHEEDEFPRAFNTLVKCPVTLIFDALLELDQNYTLIMHDLASDHHHSLMALQTRQAQEMDNLQVQNRTHLYEQHVEEMEIRQATFASDMLQTQQSQRQEYRDFVMELYREYQLRVILLSENNKSTLATNIHNSTSSTSMSLSSSTSSTSSTSSSSSRIDSSKSIDGKDLVATAANRIWKKDTGSPSCSSSSVSVPSSPSSTAKQPQNHHPQQQRRQRQDSTTSRLSQQSTTSDSWKRSSIGGGNDDLAMQKMIQDIQEMGFSMEQAEAALMLTNGQNVERAVHFLVENRDQVDQQVKRRSSSHQQQLIASSPTSATTSPPPPSSSSSSNSLHQRQDSWNDSIPSFRRHSLQKSTPPISSSSTSLQQHKPLPISALSSASSPNNSNNGGKSWNPISFLQQQKQALENTNLSSVRKLGGWLGRAMENLGIEHDENDPQFATHEGGPSSQLVESFTITLGTAQIKSSLNLRLMVADAGPDILDPLPFDEQRELGYKAQTAMRLYTSQLSAVLVLVEKHELLRNTDEEQLVDWRQYKIGKGSNRALYERTLRSTEFHFPTTESQLDLIETNAQQHRQDYLQEGSFFITKHSNLPMHQIVFHLIIDGDDILNKELTSRHPLLIGLRNILRLTTRYDISSLSLPLVMLPDRFLEQPEHCMPTLVDQPQQHITWLSKRSEAVMKTVKGYLMEASRGKQSHNEMNHRSDTSAFGGSGLHNVEFFIPMQPNVYVADPLAATTPTSASAPSSIMHHHHHHGTSSPFPPTHSSSSSSLPSLSATNSNLASGHTNDGTSTTTSGMTINASLSNTNNLYSTSSSLPSTPTASHHPQHARIPTPQVEQVFQQLRTLLVNIFRTS
ncbi:hypothetical protein BC941DRAFT_467500 [Chlamydoabsidia padenii]|nr:hypothetical protein BC941DRAFT_467500 [Chlamydoabsidia padenii]